MQHRTAGVLLHPTSLPGRYGIGSLGKEAIAFIDFLKSAKQSYWQILPLGPTGYADSPYQCFSSRAGNPYLIDIDDLVAEALLSEDDVIELPIFDPSIVMYGDVIEWKLAILKKAETQFKKNATPVQQQAFNNFIDNNKNWLDEYALFMALKQHFNNQPWYTWSDDFKLHNEDALANITSELTDIIEFHKFMQYVFFKQWNTVKVYANACGVKIIGDIPIYVAMDSVDSWANPELFQFDINKNPLFVGGCPPDYFSETGQLWGNPIFNWEVMKQDGFKWWIERIQANLLLYDLIRIDHFRGFAGYWSIPFGEETAINGNWIKGPGKELFDAIKNALGDIPIIAEDLGLITEDVIELRDHFNLPGMKILQFAFDSGESNDYIPHNYTKNCVVYTGTHDNETVRGWYEKATEEDKNYIIDYVNSDGKNIAWDLIRCAWASVAYTAIVPMQDLLNMGAEARMNLPGTTVGNWLWRMQATDIDNALTTQLKKLTELYDRAHKN